MISPDQKTVIIIAGPTACWQNFCCHSNSPNILIRKLFLLIAANANKEMNIGVARPSLQELSEVPHHFIASHTIHEKVDSSCF
jgi:tRNA dimethylallyltransferase